MARCRCAEVNCGCRVIAGQGVTVTGDGNAATPYTITAVPRSSGTIIYQNSPSVTFLTQGSGTQADPTRVQAHAVLAPLIEFADDGGVDFTVAGQGVEADPLVITADLKCLDCSVTGTPGDVLTLQLDGTYAPGPASQVAPGAVATGFGITGDGTVGNALRLDVCTYAELKQACIP